MRASTLLSLALAAGLSLGAASALDLVKVAPSDWNRASVLLGGYELVADDGVIAVVDDAQRERLEASDLRFEVIDRNEDPDLHWYVVDLLGRGMHSASLEYLRPADQGLLPAGFGAPVHDDGTFAVVLLDQEQAHELHELGYELFESQDAVVRRGLAGRVSARRRREIEARVLAEPTAADPAPVLAALDPAKRLLDHQYLVNLGTRHYSRDEGRQAAEFVKDRFEDMGLAAELQPFTYRGREVFNTVATLPGTDPSAPQVLITAHMDSTRLWGSSAHAPGADDNASGTSAMLAVARAFTGFRFTSTVKFIAFHAEEVGLIGSKAYAAAAAERGDAISGVLNMDMLGFGSQGKMEVLGDEQSAELVEIAKSLGQPVTDLEVVNTIKPNFWYSDHSSFWRKGYRAVLITEWLDDFNNHIHTTRDTFDKISAERIDQSLRVTVAMGVRLAGLEGPAS